MAGIAGLDALVAAARAEWPQLRVADEDFAAHIAERVPAGTSPDALHAGELLLAFAAGQGDRAALRAFEERFLPAAEQALARFRSGRAFVADALQELRVRLFTGPTPRILEYAGTGSLAAWVRVAAVRVAINLKHHDARHTPPAFEPALEPLPEGLADPELDILKTRYKGEVEAALRAEFRALEPAERSMLRLYAVDRLNIAEIGRIVGISRASVGRRIVDLRKKLLDGTRARLAETLGITPAELDSLFRLVQSQLDITLSRALASASASSVAG